ncbi:LuxR C-terminal-related transcriptional regulator [Candidatus Protofrankia californiensis]|uniref:LuxR C-terminal-related transcriptional regulator n=1 Tax=Candidatus Protofrankia californiensis TaxID=1839754 RepID=UPI0013EC8159|nr:LuxR C-terminal-related transcriptional regulator [Candidatus Protofrankia californiensis]
MTDSHLPNTVSSGAAKGKITMGTATVTPRRAHEWRSRLAEALSRQELADVLETIESAKRLLSPSATPALEDIHDFYAATHALNTAWTAVSRALSGDREAIEAVVSSEDLVQLLLRIRGAENIVRRIEIMRRTEAIRTVQQALGQFQDIRQINQLSNKCPKVMAEMGFDRAMLSMVDKSVWTPVSAYVDGDSEWAQAIVRSGQEHPQQLVSSLPEFELVRRRHGILVTDAQQNPKANRAIVGPSLSRSYVAAALMPEGNLIGLLHCDQYFHRGDVGELDRNLLNLFAEGFGYVLERAILLERAAAIQIEVAKLSESITAAAEGFSKEVTIASDGLSLPARRTVNTPRITHTALDAYDLTRREMEVLRLMAAGETNSQISDHLIISAGTVKSHVKHILRKLGMTNRAEVISYWFNAQQSR